MVIIVLFTFPCFHIYLNLFRLSTHCDMLQWNKKIENDCFGFTISIALLLSSHPVSACIKVRRMHIWCSVAQLSTRLLAGIRRHHRRRTHSVAPKK